MNIKSMITAVVLSLSLAAGAQVVSQAYEVALGDFRAPATPNGSAAFKECDSCERMLVRVTAATRYAINGRTVQLDDFRDAIKQARHRENAPVTVLHHLESDTIQSIAVSL